MNRTICFLLTLLLVSILPGTVGANQEMRCSSSPQIMMQNIIKLNRQGKISKTEMMQQLRLYKHSLPTNEWERLVNQSVGGGIQYTTSPAQSQLTTEAGTETGAISGQVTNGTNGLANIQITVYDVDYKWISSGHTDATGNYTVGNIPSGTDYKVKFSSQIGYGEEWYNNKTHFCSADLVSVTAPNTTENINAVMQYPGSSTISGTVTDESGVLLAGVTVYLHNENNSWNYLNSITTDSFGDYSFFGVGTGRYKIKFNGGETGYGSEWYNDKVNDWYADVVEVADPADVTGINAALAAGGISGKVTDINGTPITYYDIEVYDSNGFSQIGRFHFTSSDGKYTIAGLSAGQYKLRLEIGSYMPEWYNNKSDFEGADAELITVTPPAVTSGIDMVLEKGGSISGKVADESGVGIPNVTVHLKTDIIPYPWGSRTYSRGVNTGSEGEYAFKDYCATGDWKIEFDAGATGYVSEWHDNKTSLDTADPVHITAPETITVNAQLEGDASGGSISGRVTDGKNPLFGINVSVYDSNYSWIKSASTNCNGEYTVTGLAAGTYKIYFTDYTYGLSNKWYNDKADFDSADLIVVTNSTPTTGINAVLGSSGQHSEQQMPLAPVMMLLLNK